MSPKCLPEQMRREIIRENILTYPYDKLAELCYCTKRTITRTINKWRQEGGFEQLLTDEFFKLYPKIKQEYPDKAFDRLCYLIGRSMVQKAELKEEVKAELTERVILDVTDNEDEILSKAASILERKTKPTSIH